MGGLTVEFFDEWRKNYDHIPFEEQKRIATMHYVQHPRQTRTDAHKADALFGNFPAGRVLELGGWTGQLAKSVLRKHPEIQNWHNYEICHEAVKKPVCKDPRYRAFELNKQLWEYPSTDFSPPQGYDSFVASHVLEHIKVEQVAKLFYMLAQTAIEFVWVEIPVEDGPPDWKGYHGAHILEVGWNRLIPLITSFGFSLQQVPSHKFVRVFAR